VSAHGAAHNGKGQPCPLADRNSLAGVDEPMKLSRPVSLGDGLRHKAIITHVNDAIQPE
jgi:hypothetical protein